MNNYKSKNKSIKLISENKKVRYEYFIIDYYEAGMILLGSEVKSLRMGKSNLRDSYARIINGEIFVYQVHIGKYKFANDENHDPNRPKKLLLHKKEIKKLYSKINEKGYTLVPIKIYFKNGIVKISLGLAKGKCNYDKRETIRQRDQQRSLDIERKRYN